MFSALSTGLGLLTGGGSALLLNGFKGILGIFEEKQKLKLEESRNKHELDLLDRQGQIQANIAFAKSQGDVAIAQESSYTAETIAKEESIRTAIKSDNAVIAFLNGSVRPLTTYAYSVYFFFLIYVLTKAYQLKSLPIEEFMKQPIILSFIALNEMIISFWFINREFAKRWKK